MFVIAATLRVRLLVNASSHGQRQVQVLKNLSDTRPRGRASTRTTQGQVSGAPRGDKPGGTGIEAEITSGVESQRANGGLNRPADETQAGEGIATNIDELDGKYEWIRENMVGSPSATFDLQYGVLTPVCLVPSCE